jgi:hypothetical protein
MAVDDAEPKAPANEGLVEELINAGESLLGGIPNYVEFLRHVSRKVGS